MGLSTSIVSSLKKLAVKIKGSGTGEDFHSTSIAGVIDEITNIYTKGEGVKGDKGVGVKAIALTTDEAGKVTGGTVTFTDDSTSAITVTQASA